MRALLSSSSFFFFFSSHDPRLTFRERELFVPSNLRSFLRSSCRQPFAASKNSNPRSELIPLNSCEKRGLKGRNPRTPRNVKRSLRADKQTDYNPRRGGIFLFFSSLSLTGVVDRDLLTLENRCVGEEEGGEIRGDRLVTEIYRELRSASKVLRDRGCPRFFNNLGGYIFLDD